METCFRLQPKYVVQVVEQQYLENHLVLLKLNRRKNMISRS